MPVPSSRPAPTPPPQLAAPSCGRSVTLFRGLLVGSSLAACCVAFLRVMVFLGSLLYIVGLILTDISYTLVDPRIRLE